MKEKQQYVLHVNLTQEEIDHAVFSDNLLHAKSIVITTESTRSFQLLISFPRLYQLIVWLPQFDRVNSHFNEYIQYVIEKSKYIKAQNFELARKYRDLENDAANTIITGCNLKSFNMKEIILKNGTIRLFVILLVR